MHVQKLLQKCDHLKVDGGNDISEDYVERIIFRNDLKDWEKVFTECLGPPVKQAGENTTDLLFKLTVDYGGILDDQILFCKKIDDHTVIAMIWPWKDNYQMTLKIARIRNLDRS